jgi:peptidyl-prolyl cis-trans isomerase SurA
MTRPPSMRLARVLLLLGLFLAGVLGEAERGAHAAEPAGPPAPAAPAASSAQSPGAAQAAKPQAAPPPLDPEHESRILAVVNGEAITSEDVDNRRRLFALSTGLPMTPEVLDRLTPQVVRQLIDEKLQLQEVQRRKIAISDKDVAEAVVNLEKRNNMPPGALAKRLAAGGAEIRTLYDQIRVQLGWSRVLRAQITAADRVTDADVNARLAAIKAETGQMEYHVAEIFISAEDRAHIEDARHFAETVIGELRKGAPFALIAAQFSQSQTALQGGDLGWVQLDQLEPPVARIVSEMPVGAVSNPIPVAGGLSIVTLLAKRQIGNDPATILKVRQVFYKFATPLDPANPTPDQVAELNRAKQVSASVHDCDGMVAAAKAAGTTPTPEPLELRLETVTPPQLKDLFAKLPDSKASEPLVTRDGILVVMVCSREQRNLGMPSREEVMNQLLMQRLELISRQLMRDLRRRASIETRIGGGA